MRKFFKDDTDIINFWNDDDRIEDAVAGSGMRIMTYDKIIGILLNANTSGKETLSGVKVIVFDECHTIFSDTYIRGMEALQVWIRGELYGESKFIIGMTATPGMDNGAHLDELVECPGLVILNVLKSQMVLNLLANKVNADIEDMEDEKDDWKYFFDYEYIPDTKQEMFAAICVDTDVVAIPTGATKRLELCKSSSLH